MEFEGKATILTAESKPYSMAGNEGVSHRIRINMGGEIWNCKSTADQVSEAQKYVGKDVEVVIRFESRKESLSLKLVSIEG